MEVVTSQSGNVSVMVGSIIRQYYFRGDGGALVNKAFGPDLMEPMQSGEWQQSLVAHKADVVLIFPQRAGYKPERRLTLGDFYVNELFREVWCIPVNSWIVGKKDWQEGKMTPFIVSTFLMRGQSNDEFNSLLQPIEEQSFIEWQMNQKTLKQEYASINDFVGQKMMEILQNSIYTFTIAKGEGVKTYYYLSWSMRPPANEIEQETIEIAQVIAKQHGKSLINDVVEKAAVKALGSSVNGTLATIAGADEIGF